MSFRRFTVCLTSFIGLAIAALPLGASPAMVLAAQSVSVQDMTPNGRAMIFSISKPPSSFMPVTARLEVMREIDGTGAVSLELPSPVVERSVWAVVDVESGEVALASPEGFELRLVVVPGNGVGQSRRFLLSERRFLEVLLVRPADAVPPGQDAAAESGAWGESFGDGGTNDGDGEANGRIEAVLDRLHAIGDSRELPPDELRPGDVVIAVDPVTLEIYAATLAF